MTQLRVSKWNNAYLFVIVEERASGSSEEMDSLLERCREYLESNSKPAGRVILVWENADSSIGSYPPEISFRHRQWKEIARDFKEMECDHWPSFLEP